MDKMNVVYFLLCIFLLMAIFSNWNAVDRKIEKYQRGVELYQYTNNTYNQMILNELQKKNSRLKKSNSESDK